MLVKIQSWLILICLFGPRFGTVLLLSFLLGGLMLLVGLVLFVLVLPFI
jgi:hypothetical protein